MKKADSTLELDKMMANVKGKSPVIHCITNYVTVNACANILLASGASPIISDDEREVEEITALCQGLIINIGTLNKNTIQSMFVAGKKANESGNPVVLDPVGAGASGLRTETALKLINDIKFTAIRGNYSEIRAIAAGSIIPSESVDENHENQENSADDHLGEAIKTAKKLAKKTGSLIIITGAIDIVTDGKHTFLIRNGHPMMSWIAGSGCMLSTLLTAYLAANEENLIEAAVAAVCVMGISGQNAFKRMKKNVDGNASYSNYLIDSVCLLDGVNLLLEASYEAK